MKHYGYFVLSFLFLVSCQVENDDDAYAQLGLKSTTEELSE